MRVCAGVVIVKHMIANMVLPHNAEFFISFPFFHQTHMASLRLLPPRFATMTQPCVVSYERRKAGGARPCRVAVISENAILDVGCDCARLIGLTAGAVPAAKREVARFW